MFSKESPISKAALTFKSKSKETESPKPEKATHDAPLSGAIKHGHMIKLELMDGTTVLGVAARKDPYTITIGEITGRKLTYFKHFIHSFEVIDNHPEADNYREKNKSRNTGHEIVLALAIKGGKVIIIKTIHGKQEVGFINQFDPYTITIIKEDGQKKTIFKHSIARFETAGGKN